MLMMLKITTEGVGPALASRRVQVTTKEQREGISCIHSVDEQKQQNQQKMSSTPKLGPEPVLLSSRKEVDALYDTLKAVVTALETLHVEHIVTGGTLLGAIREHSLLFCDDDIDIAIIDLDGQAYDKVSRSLQRLLGEDYQYQIRVWEGGDKVRPKRMNTVFLDLFTLRRFDTMEDLITLIGVKKNGHPQSSEYIQSIVSKIEQCAMSQGETSPLCPFWHFNTRKAIEMWPKEVYREKELFPLLKDLKFGPLTGIQGPRTPVHLLKRAFGPDCFEVYYASVSHTSGTREKDHHVDEKERGSELPPLVAAGGTWEGGLKMPLQDIHYLPMQPLSRAARRPTLHCKEALFQYLEEQTKRETAWLQQEECSVNEQRQQQQQRRPPRRTVYMDGVFDLFHIGHLEAIRQCAALGDRVIIGVTGDADATGYKRRPIVPESERVDIVRSLLYVDEVVCPCPLVVTEAFIEEKGIDLVVHGFANDTDAKRQEEFFAIPMKLGKFQRIEYYQGLSTTERLDMIRGDSQEESGGIAAKENTSPPQQKCSGNGGIRARKPLFGATVAEEVGSVEAVPFDPFPLSLRIAMEPHIQKARKRREEVLKAIRDNTGLESYDAIIDQFKSSLANETDSRFDCESYALREALLKSFEVSDVFDLSLLHQKPGTKDKLLYNLTQKPAPFQAVYDEFVRNVCVPQIAETLNCDEVYYQAFPCIRVIQPNEFSIGPHTDAAYGHHPCSVNFYVPFTYIGGTSAVFLESRPGSEDWHPIVGDYGTMKRFAGAVCTHWTTDNKTDRTRVSIDFRVIAGPMFRALACGGSLPGGQRDVYREKGGFYSCCRKEHCRDTIVWNREGGLLAPDSRMGFPWTVKNWTKFWSKNDNPKLQNSAKQ